MNYYMITAARLENRELVKIKAYKTSADFSIFLPPQEFTRKEMITLLRQGDIFYSVTLLDLGKLNRSLFFLESF